MKTYLLGLGLFLALLPSVFAKVIVISDIDDTIKKANSANPGLGQAYHFLKKKVYFETRDLFQELEKSYERLGEEVEFYYVSAAPDMIFNQEKWLTKHKFPAGKNRLRRFGDGDTYTYKTTVIGNILQRMQPNDTFYFFGDNSSKDAIVYKELSEKMGLVNTHIFIRDVDTKATYWNDELTLERLENVNYFFSEMELVGHPALFFMSSALKQRVRKAYDKQKLIPEYTYKTMVRRLEDEWACCKWGRECSIIAKEEAMKLWQDYHRRF